ncbi:WD40 repeat domain-containing protein [Nocardia sp. alder85J]|nr:WD40 repeat domain-containing protein [Nocardia sp. alder85J]
MTVAGVLPLLSHALDTAWRIRTSDTLTVADYERTGGIAGAVATSAQRVYDNLPAFRRLVARQVFTRLAVTGPDGADTADRVARTSLYTTTAWPAEVDAVLDAFAAERLLTLGSETVEVSHEIVLRAWPLLRDVWLAETHDTRVLLTRLRTVAAEWDQHGRDPAYLYTGSVLDTATTAADHAAADSGRYPTLGEPEREFLVAASAAARRRTRQRRAVLVALLALVIGLTAATLVAVRTGTDATRQRDLAEARQLISQSALLADSDPFTSRFDALTAWRISGLPEARTAAIKAAHDIHLAELANRTKPVEALAFSPDSRTLTTAGATGAEQWDITTRREIGSLSTDLDYKTDKDRVLYAFSSDRRTFAISNGHTIQLWDLTTYQQLSAPDHTAFVLALSPDGQTLAFDSNDVTIELWDVAGHRPLGGIPIGTRHIFSLAFSPDGRALAVGAEDIQLWDVGDQQRLGDPLTNGTRFLADSLAFSADGRILAASLAINDGHAVQLWDVAGHRPLGDPFASAKQLTLAMSPDGRTLATGGPATTQIWDTANRRPLGDPVASTGPVDSLAFSPDGRILAAGEEAGTVQLLSIAGHRLSADTVPGPAMRSLAFSLATGMVATTDAADTVRLWDLAGQRQLGDSLTTDVRFMVFSPDGENLATCDVYGVVRLWDVPGHRQLGDSFTIDKSEVLSLAFSADSRTLAIGKDGSVQLWDIATRTRPVPPLTFPGPVYSLAFSTDGHTLAVGDNTGTVQLLSITGDQHNHSTISTGTRPVLSLAFSADGRTLVTENTISADSTDSTVRLWDVAGRRQLGGPLTNNTSNVSSLAFSRDGRTLAITSDDATVQRWNVEFLVDPGADLCAWAQAQFTRTEWDKNVEGGTTYRQLCP